METKLEKIFEKENLKAYGAVSTPEEVIEFMLKVSGIEKWQGLRILEPGCGFCHFLSHIYVHYPDNEFTGIEVNPQIYNMTVSLYPQFSVVLDDFLLWDSDRPYDLVIGNPPYGIIGDESHYPIHVLKDRKTLYKRLSSAWYGKFNIYGAFIEKGLKLLKSNGKLIFIVPATFMILDDFKFLRKLLSVSGRIKIFYLGAGVFDGKSVSTAVLVVEKGGVGIELYEVDTKLKDGILCFRRNKYDGDIIRFDNYETRRFEEGKKLLGDLFAFHFAARSPEIRNHPLVSTEAKEGFVPVLTGRNLHSGWIDYDSCYSGLWMPKEAAPSLRPFYGFPHIVIGHTKGGKLVAAMDKCCYPWREDIHLIPRIKNLNLDEITLYLNSKEVQHYVHMLYRDITPHITITQLKLLPVRGVYDEKPEKRLALL